LRSKNKPKKQKAERRRRKGKPGTNGTSREKGESCRFLGKPQGKADRRTKLLTGRGGKRGRGLFVERSKGTIFTTKKKNTFRFGGSGQEDQRC